MKCYVLHAWVQIMNTATARVCRVDVGICVRVDSDRFL